MIIMAKIALIKDKLVNYVKASYQELRRVVWPTRKEVIQHTVVVILFSLGISLFLFILDSVFSLGVAEIIKLKF